MNGVSERLPHLLQIGRLAAQPAQRRLSVGDGGSYGLFHFMGDRCSELPHGRSAVRVRQLHLHLPVAAFALACFYFRPLAIGDVSNEGEGEPLATLIELSYADLDRKHRPILSAVTTLEGYDLRVIEATLDPFHERLIGIRIDIERRHADQFIAAIPQALACLTVHVDYGSVFAVEHQRIGRVVDEGAEARLASAQFLLGTLALAQINDKSDALVLFFADRCPTDKHRNAAAVLAEVLLLARLGASRSYYFRHTPCGIVAPFRRGQLTPAHAPGDEIFAIVLDDAQKRFVGFENSTFDIPDEDADDIGLEQAPDLCFACCELSMQGRQRCHV